MTAPEAVELRIAALATHVRTARLVAAAVARRFGVEPGVLDDIKVAVGEATSRAVALHARHDQTEPILITFADSDGFEVSVRDSAPVALTLPGSGEGGNGRAAIEDLDVQAFAATVGLALMQELAPEVTVDDAEQRGSVVRLRWPTSH